MNSVLSSCLACQQMEDITSLHSCHSNISSDDIILLNLDKVQMNLSTNDSLQVKEKCTQDYPGDSETKLHDQHEIIQEESEEKAQLRYEDKSADQPLSSPNQTQIIPQVKEKQIQNNPEDSEAIVQDKHHIIQEESLQKIQVQYKEKGFIQTQSSYKQTQIQRQVKEQSTQKNAGDSEVRVDYLYDITIEEQPKKRKGANLIKGKDLKDFFINMKRFIRSMTKHYRLLPKRITFEQLPNAILEYGSLVRQFLVQQIKAEIPQKHSTVKERAHAHKLKSYKQRALEILNDYF